MCGLAGIWGRADKETVAHMLDQQKHRGPDGRNIWAAGNGAVALGHDRLAIIDVAGGAQPLANEDGSLWAVVNGEIYNYRALRAELEGRHHFSTDSDSEVVLHLFEEEGPEFVNRLDGMFAIAIWGEKAGLYLARDPLGIKPLYYGLDDSGNMLFASEIKAILPEVTELSALAPGTYWVQGDDPVQYYHVPEPTVTQGHPDDVIDELDRVLTEAVVKRLMADVPLGVFLSGGLDSSLIAAIVRRHVPGELHSFSVGLEGSADLINARRVAEDLGTVHHERVLRPSEVIAALPKVVDLLESCDPALVRSAIPTYFVSEMAAQHVKVVLSGEGADELFAGYHYLVEFEPDPHALNQELLQITRNLHNSNLQRVDRMTMAHGLEGRVPFLDKNVVDLAFRLGSSLKRYDGHGKWVLRKVADRYLAPSIVWRRKEKFAIGTGVGEVLESYAGSVISQEQLCQEPAPGGRPFDSREEWLYWSLFKGRYGRTDVLLNMGRSRSLNPGQVWASAL